jgi:hypothetical protein
MKIQSSIVLPLKNHHDIIFTHPQKTFFYIFKPFLAQTFLASRETFNKQFRFIHHYPTYQFAFEADLMLFFCSIFA